MDYSELFDFFQRVERESVVQQWIVEDLHVWPLVRIGLGATYENLMVCSGREDIGSGRKASAQLAEGRIGAWTRLVTQALSDEVRCRFFDAEHQQKNEPCDVVILGESVLRNVKMPSGEAFDSLLDPIAYTLQAEKYKVFRFELVGPGALKLPRWGKSTPISFLQLWARIRRKWAWKRRDRMKTEERLYGQIMKGFSQLKPGLRQIPWEEVVFQMLFIHYLAEAFQQRIAQIFPKVVILDCWYSSVQMALSVAAHKLGIPVVEVQHGMAGGSDNHPAYIDWLNMPRKGYEVMPDYMWGWEQSDCDAIARWGEDKVTPILGGRPMNLIWGNRESDISRSYQKKYEKEFGSPRPTILFTLQWGIQYPEWFLDFVNQTDKYTWLIRLHPVVDENERAFLKKLEKKENIIWRGVDSFPLDVLLMNVVLHITMYSSSVIEAEEVGCHSIVIHPFACRAFASQIKRGVVRYVDNPKDLLAAIYDDLPKRVQMRDDVGRMKELYAQGKSGIRRLIEIMKRHQL